MEIATPKNFFLEPYEKLNKVLGYLDYKYKKSPYAGMCWILEEVLGVDPTTVALEGFNASNYTYETFMFDVNGKKRVFSDGEVAKLTVSWTKEQRMLIREWWEYIPSEFK